MTWRPIWNDETPELWFACSTPDSNLARNITHRIDAILEAQMRKFCLPMAQPEYLDARYYVGLPLRFVGGTWTPVGDGLALEATR